MQSDVSWCSTSGESAVGSRTSLESEKCSRVRKRRKPSRLAELRLSPTFAEALELATLALLPITCSSLFSAPTRPFLQLISPA